MILGSGLTTVCQQILLPTPRSPVALRYGSSRKLIQMKRRPSQVCRLERISTLLLNNVSSHRQAHRVKAATQLASPSGLLPGAPMLPKEEKRVKGVEGGSGRTKPATWDSLQLVFLSSSISLPPPSSQSVTPVLKTLTPNKMSSRISEAVPAWGPLPCTTPPGPPFAYSVAANWASHLAFSLPLSGTFLCRCLHDFHSLFIQVFTQ